MSESIRVDIVALRSLFKQRKISPYPKWDLFFSNKRNSYSRIDSIYLKNVVCLSHHWLASLAESVIPPSTRQPSMLAVILEKQGLLEELAVIPRASSLASSPHPLTRIRYTLRAACVKHVSPTMAPHASCNESAEEKYSGGCEQVEFATFLFYVWSCVAFCGVVIVSGVHCWSSANLVRQLDFFFFFCSPRNACRI